MAAVYSMINKGSSKEDAPARAPRSKNAQRVLLLSSRGVNARHRHLLNDLALMLPHGRREAKFDSKKKLHELNELAEMYNCNNIMYLETRKRSDLYLHVAKAPNGPTVRFHVQNLHTMEELHFTGNCLKGSRPILSFDSAFDSEPHLQLIKELFTQSFGVPPGARKSKPFIDHIMGFTLADGKIWVRHYQIAEEDADKGDTDTTLREIGPRFCLTPTIIQEGSFGGPIIYHNRAFVSPNQVRADVRKEKVLRRTTREGNHLQTLTKKGHLGLRTGGRVASTEGVDSKKLFS